MITEAEVREGLKKYHFYHTIPLTESLYTEGWPAIRDIVSMVQRNLRTLDLAGKRVLDIGCRDGLFCFEAEKMGAAEVVGIDNDPSVAAREFIIPVLRSRVNMHELNVYDLRPETFGMFDVVIFPGVLYHLRYPIWALRLVRDVLKDDGVLVLETATYVDDNRRPLLFCPVGGESPYEPTSCTFFNLKALRDTLHSLGLSVRRAECLVNYHKALETPPPVVDRTTMIEAVRRAHCRNCQPTPAVVDRTTLAAAVQRVLGVPPEPKDAVVDRTVMICDMTPAAKDPLVTAYWDGYHQINSRDIPATDFRDFQAG